METKTYYCNFCGKSQHDVKKLIAGPTVFICDECTDLCADILHRTAGAPKPPPAENAPGSLGCHEVLHLLNVFGDTFNRHVAAHLAIRRHPEWRKEAEAIGTAIAALDKAIACEHIEESPTEEARRGEIIGFGDVE